MPRYIQEKSNAMPKIEASQSGTLNLLIEMPNNNAIIINKIEEVPAPGMLLNVSDTIIINTAIKRINVVHEKIRNNFLPLLPIYTLIICPIDLPLCRIEAMMDE